LIKSCQSNIYKFKQSDIDIPTICKMYYPQHIQRVVALLHGMVPLNGCRNNTCLKLNSSTKSFPPQNLIKPTTSWTSRIHLRPSDIGCQHSRSIYTARFIVWQPHRAEDTSTNWRQSLFCCCTASMEHAADGAKTAATDRLVSS